MPKNFGKSGVCDPAPIIQLMQKASMLVGRAGSSSYNAIQNETVLMIYEKNGKFYPVTSVIDNTQPNLELSALTHRPRPLEDMHNARKVMDIPYKAFNDVWNHNDDACLSNQAEAIEKLQMITEVFTEGPIDGALAMGAKVYDALGREKRPADINRTGVPKKMQYV